MDRRVLIAAIIAVIVIGVAGYAAWKVSKTSPNAYTNGPVGSENTGPITREDVSAGTRVPSQGGNAAGGVAVPQIVAPAAADSKLSKRIFAITVNNNKIDTPNIVVYAGDLVTLTITAVDKAYNFVQPDYGLRFNLKQGETKTFDNQFTTPGKYLFYCDSCGGPESEPRGYFTVVPK